MRYPIVDIIYGTILVCILVTAITIVICRVLSRWRRRYIFKKYDISNHNKLTEPAEQCVDCFNITNTGKCKKEGNCKVVDGKRITVTYYTHQECIDINADNKCKHWEDRNTFIICFLSAIDIILWCLSYGVLNVISILAGGK